MRKTNYYNILQENLTDTHWGLALGVNFEKRLHENEAFFRFQKRNLNILPTQYCSYSHVKLTHLITELSFMCKLNERKRHNLSVVK